MLNHRTEKGDGLVRQVRLSDAQSNRRLALVQPHRGNDLVDGVGEPQFRLPLFRIRISEVGEDIAGPTGKRSRQRWRG